MVRFSILFFRDYDTVGYLLSACNMREGEIETYQFLNILPS